MLQSIQVQPQPAGGPHPRKRQDHVLCHYVVSGTPFQAIFSSMLPTRAQSGSTPTMVIWYLRSDEAHEPLDLHAARTRMTLRASSNTVFCTPGLSRGYIGQSGGEMNNAVVRMANRRSRRASEQGDAKEAR